MVNKIFPCFYLRTICETDSDRPTLYFASLQSQFQTNVLKIRKEFDIVNARQMLDFKFENIVESSY